MIKGIRRFIPFSLAFGIAISANTIAAEQTAQLEFLLPERVYYIDISIKDATGTQKQIPVIFDTGAAYSIVHPFDLEGVKLERIRNENILLADGSLHPLSLYLVPTLTIANCELHDVEILVSDNAVANFLGVNVLTKIMPFTVTPDAVSFKCPPDNPALTPSAVNHPKPQSASKHQTRNTQ